jgi:HSP20 family protein
LRLFLVEEPKASLNSLMDNFFKWDYEPSESLPPVNVIEKPEGFRLSLVIPGFKKEDIKVGIENKVLTIKGEHNEENMEENAKYTRKEFSMRSFVRSFSLPESVNFEAMAAKYEDGVLNIHLPKRDEAKLSNTREIVIE